MFRDILYVAFMCFLVCISQQVFVWFGDMFLLNTGVGKNIVFEITSFC